MSNEWFDEGMRAKRWVVREATFAATYWRQGECWYGWLVEPEIDFVVSLWVPHGQYAEGWCERWFGGQLDPRPVA